MRLVLGLGPKPILLLALILRLHHHFRGAPIDYGALAAAAAASWIGLPGPGEPVLIAAGVFAAHHRLDIGSVLVVAFLGATAGGIAGWLVGMKAGRAVLTAPGPLLRLRSKAIARGDQVFTRAPVLAVLLAPSWIAGIHRVSSRLYLPVNALSAAAWAGGIGLGAYYVGPSVVDAVDDLGWVLVSALVVLVLAVIGGSVLQQRRSKRRREARY